MRIFAILSFIVLLLMTCSPEGIGNGIGTPVLVSPMNGSTITQNPPTLIWQTVATATAYDVMLADNSSFDYPGVIANVQCHASTEYTPINTLGTGTYFWKVRAIEGG